MSERMSEECYAFCEQYTEDHAELSRESLVVAFEAGWNAAIREHVSFYVHRRGSEPDREIWTIVPRPPEDVFGLVGAEIERRKHD